DRRRAPPCVRRMEPRERQPAVRRAGRGRLPVPRPAPGLRPVAPQDAAEAAPAVLHLLPGGRHRARRDHRDHRPAVLAAMATPPLLRDGATFGYRMAHGLAYAVNPLVLPPLLFGLVLAHFGAPAAEVARAVAVALVGCGLVPLAYVVYLVRRRRVASVEVR